MMVSTKLQKLLTSIPVLFAAVLLTITKRASSQVINQDSPVCKGVFDFYFVLDSSGSVSDNFHTEIVTFVENITEHYIEPDFRIAFITFASESFVHLNLTRTANRDGVLSGITRLQDLEPGGSTLLAPGLEHVNDQISTRGGDAASVVLVLTDGDIKDQSQATVQANSVRLRGGSIFAIGVGDSDRAQLSEIADKDDQVYIGNDFQYLSQVIDTVVNQTCVEIRSVVPAQVCIGSTENVTLNGRGFTNKLIQGQSACRFKTGDGRFYLTRPSVEDVRYSTITCPVPNFNNTGVLLLQVSTNGISFISSNVTMVISACQPADAGYVAAVFFGLLGLIVLVGLVLVWFFLPLITGKVAGGLPPEKKEPKPKGTPGRKWEVVDASYYGGRGAGGIKPMTVRWGDKGATEEGNKLEKAKDAGVVTVKREPGKPAPYTKPPSCWAITKQRILRWYAVAASYRPVFTVKKRILWFPNRVMNKYTIQTNRNSLRERTSSDSKA